MENEFLLFHFKLYSLSKSFIVLTLLPRLLILSFVLFILPPRLVYLPFWFCRQAPAWLHSASLTGTQIWLWLNVSCQASFVFFIFFLSPLLFSFGIALSGKWGDMTRSSTAIWLAPSHFCFPLFCFGFIFVPTPFILSLPGFMSFPKSTEDQVPMAVWRTIKETAHKKIIGRVTGFWLFWNIRGGGRCQKMSNFYFLWYKKKIISLNPKSVHDSVRCRDSLKMGLFNYRRETDVD